MCLDWTQFEGIEDAPLPQGWSGPYKGKYLENYCQKKKDRVKYETLEHALETANKLKICGGITYNKKDGYTLRKGISLCSNYDESNISWTKTQ